MPQSRLTQRNRPTAVRTAWLPLAIAIACTGCIMEGGVGVASHTTVKGDGSRHTSNDFDSSPDGNPATTEYNR